MLGLGFLRERKARAVVANTLPSLPEGIQLLPAADRAATLALVNAMIEAAADRWGPSVAKGPSAMPRATVVEVVLALAQSHARVARDVLEPIQDRSMADVQYAQAMREIRARELLVATLGASLVEGRKPGVGQAWRLLWNARGEAGAAAEALLGFARHARADAVPRTRRRPRAATEADLRRLASTLPAFLGQQRPPPARAPERPAGKARATARAGEADAGTARNPAAGRPARPARGGAGDAR